ncbi:SLAM family member 6-like isoform X2 [Tiliqua scincoides]
MQGGSVLLQINSSLSGNMVNRIEWIFQPKGSKPFTIAEFQGVRTQRPNPSDRFGERLEAINETRLRIKDLELEDAGVYEARVRLSSAEYDVYTFSLTVHKPVPEPQIWHQVAADTPSGCNVTLQCQAPGPGEFSVSWRRGSPPRSLAGGADWYRLSANRMDLHLFWKPNSLDSNLTCLVSSAVDQKEASFDLLGICSFEGRNRTLLLSSLVLCAVLVLILGVVFGIWQWKKRRKTLSHSALSEGSPAEPQYAEIAKKNFAEGNEDQDLDCRSDPKYPTVYAQLNRPQRSPEQVT